MAIVNECLDMSIWTRLGSCFLTASHNYNSFGKAKYNPEVAVMVSL